MNNRQEMTYDETVRYLLNSAPPFQQVGGTAYKEGLETSIALDNHLGNPHKKFITIHIAGTNGKGSTSHTLAAILQECGYKVGLYTSPHLIDFRERIKVNGKVASEKYVIDFVENHKTFFEPLSPSFFELTTAMAFNYFAEQEVEIAVIEVGLGGRLDCTNIINPVLSIITNISIDHTQFLGGTLTEIAGEKAGIIKPGVPVVIGETTPETKEVFKAKAAGACAPIVFAEEEALLTSAQPLPQGGFIYESALYGRFEGELGGDYQKKNTNTLLSALKILKETGIAINGDALRKGFTNVCGLTGFEGRWQTICDSPRTVCDAGHNTGGIKYIAEQLERERKSHTALRIVFGMVDDKEVDAALGMMPVNAQYYFTQAAVQRAIPADKLQAKASHIGLKGKSYPTVKEALQAARADSGAKDFIFVGGSCYVVADLLKTVNAQ